MNKHESIVSSGIGKRESEDAKNKLSAQLQKTKKPHTSRSSVSRSAARAAWEKKPVSAAAGASLSSRIKTVLVMYQAWLAIRK